MLLIIDNEWKKICTLIFVVKNVKKMDNMWRKKDKYL